MILIGFKTGIFPLPKKYPSESNCWKEDAMDSSKFLLKGSNGLSSSVQRIKSPKNKNRNIWWVN